MRSYVAWLYIGLPPTHIPRLIFLRPKSLEMPQRGQPYQSFFNH
ncbi:hypothetical protein NC653_017718 [Populus alba x Populus x berolinensis]|uniref:Uncharacterized protein n=1 Tax=Populus alba x Populus x berolinensis TaxID=444605 RepID=A0AAD6QRS7_9ROSI|nr:hypothetical protein NC653_017718 [Populus alba x Populus x berolinensis]